MTKQAIYMLRHGESTSNVKRVWSFEGELTKTGIKQCEYWASYFKDENIAGVYASSIKRTLQTAEIISRTLKLPVIISDDIIEVNGGIFMEKSVDLPQKRAIEQKLYKSWENNMVEKSYPNGESFLDVKLRLENFLKKLKTSGDILMVSHQLAIAVFLWAFCVNRLKSFSECLIGRAGMVKLERVSDKSFRLDKFDAKPQIS